MKKILIIDDDPDSTNTIANYLQSKGYRYFTANSGEEGIKIAKKEKPDFVISDIGLGEGMTGWDVLAQLKNQTKVILMSGGGEKDYMSSLTISRGGTGFLKKTFKYSELLCLLD